MLAHKLRRATSKGSNNLEFVPSAEVSATTGTINISANAAIGDLAVLTDITILSTLPIPVPTGWTQLATSNILVSGIARYQILVTYRILVSGDPGAAVSNTGGTNRRRGMQVFRRGSGISSVSPSTWNSQSTGAVPTQQTVPASGQGTPLVVFGIAATGTLSSATLTSSPAMDGTLIIDTNDVLMSYKIYNTSPANHTFDSSDAGTANHLASGYISITG